jgi:hypothetical protein
MSEGFICDWDYSTKLGKISSCTGQQGVFPFDFDHCSTDLKNSLTQHQSFDTTGPCPGPEYSIQVTFTLGISGKAIDVDIAD